VAAVVQSGRHASIGLTMHRTRRTDPRQIAHSSSSGSRISPPGRSESCRMDSFGGFFLRGRGYAGRACCFWMSLSPRGQTYPISLMVHVATVVASGTAVFMTTHHRSEWPACATHELSSHAARDLLRSVRSSAVQARTSVGG